jgi:WD40 repeat protein
MRIWNLDPAQSAHILNGHESEVDGLVITQDGRFAVSSSWDHTVKVWDVISGREIRTFTGHTAAVWTVAATADLVVSGSWDCSIRVWGLADGRELLRLPGRGSAVQAVAVTPDGSRAAAAAEHTGISVWDVVSGAHVRSIAPDESPVSALVLDATGNRLLYGTLSGAVRMVDVATGDGVYELGGSDSRVLALSISQDGRVAAACSDDGVLRVWSAETGEGLSERTAAGPLLDTAAVSDGGRRRVLAAHERAVWVAAEPAAVPAPELLEGHRHWVRSLAITPAGDVAVSGSGDRTVRLWDLDQMAERGRLVGHEDEVWAVAVAAGASRVASAAWDRMLAVWDIDRVQRITAAHVDRAITCLGVSSDGRIIIAGDEAGELHCFDLVEPPANASPK